MRTTVTIFQFLGEIARADVHKTKKNLLFAIILHNEHYKLFKCQAQIVMSGFPQIEMSHFSEGNATFG